MALPKIIHERGAVHLAAEAAATGHGRPAFDPDVPPAVLALVPEAVARENVILPLRLVGETLVVATARPDDVLLADKLSFILNKRIKLVPAPREAIQAAINEHYGQTETESVDSMLVEFTDTAIDFAHPGAVQSHAHSGVIKSAMMTGGMPRPQARQSFGRSIHVPARHDSDDDDFEQSLGEGRAARPRLPGEDATPDYGSRSMWYYTVEEGQRALRVRTDGRMDVIVGPSRVWRGSSRFERMRHFVAHPGEFLVVRFRDGRQEHVAGPADVWFDPRVHETVTRQDALQLAAKEAVVVYSRAGDDGQVGRRIVYGPTVFVPGPGEWLHTFTWHGSDGGSKGERKVAKGLVFQKLWLMPDQMYHDVPDVRTADDAVLTVRLMIFFELIDISRMLEASHDPIGDFVNAATSDVVDFTGRLTFDQFKHNTGLLNELETYKQLAARAAQTGYRINKVVYRGYGAPDRLQAMQDQAIEARTKLQLERATEQQAQELEDFKLTAQLTRAVRRRAEQATEVETELDLARRRQEAEMRTKEAERTAAREQRRRDAETQLDARAEADRRQREHLAALREMGVDLTAYLTQGRADRVIELRGAAGTHVHLDRVDGEGERRT